MVDIEGSIKTQQAAPLLSWDVFSVWFDELGEKGKRKLDLKTLQHYHAKNRWEIDLERVLDSTYEALVLTNSGVAIEWVSDGFTKMTGYNKSEAIGKSPKILHGANTSIVSRKRVKKNLFGHDAFTEDLINYRKNGEEYICRIEVHPIFNTSNELTHYLALEQEVR